MRRWWLSVVALAAFLPAVHAGALRAQAPGSGPAFVPAACGFRVPLWLTEGVSINCGTVTVPASRTDPTEGTVQLAVALLPATVQPAANPPLLYLSGGPGGAGISEGLDILGQFNGNLPDQTHDVILTDMRGTGGSLPSLACPEIDSADDANIAEGQDLNDLVQRETAGAQACKARLEGQGVDLADFTSSATAADLDDIRSALGYSQISLWGISYGTRIALEYMRDFPDRVAGAIIDGVVPVQLDLMAGYVPNANRAFSAMFADCAADAKCNAAYPNLSTRFWALVDKLNAAPLQMRTSKPNGDRVTIPLTGNALIGFTFNAMYVSQLIPRLPAMIAAAEQGDTSLIGAFAGQFFFEHGVNQGLYLSITCSDYTAYSTLDAVSAATAGLPPELVNSQMEPADVFAMCNVFGVPPTPPEQRQPLVSTIPTLVLSGELDPITPPANGRLAASTLANSYVYVFPGGGHGNGPDTACGRSFVQAFLNNPNADPGTTPQNSACFAALKEPNWLITH